MTLTKRREEEIVIERTIFLLPLQKTGEKKESKTKRLYWWLHYWMDKYIATCTHFLF
jgi:hypothetical protein